MSDRARKAAEDELVGLFEWHRLSKPPVDAMRDRVRKILERHYPEPAPTVPSDAVPVRCAEEDPEGYNARIVTPVTAPAAEPETPTLNDLLEKARTHVMTPEEKEAQRQSWVRGEAAMGESTVKAEPEAGAREALAVTCHTCGATYEVRDGVGELVEARAHREREERLRHAFDTLSTITRESFVELATLVGFECDAEAVEYDWDGLVAAIRKEVEG